MHAVRASRRLPAEAGREIRAAVATARAATASRTLRGAQLFLSNTSRSSSPNFRTANAGFSASAALATGGHPCPPSHLGTRHHSNGPTASLPSVRSNDGRHKRSILRKMPVQVCGLSTTLGSGRLLDTARAVAAVGGGWCGSGLAARRSMSTMSEREFHSMADEELECIHDDVEGALEDGFEDEFDCNMSQGVLNIIVGDRGTWVLNKQAPNRQIWWSSPISGPMRFEYDGKSQRWVNTRDGETELRTILTVEMKEKCGVDI